MKQSWIVGSIMLYVICQAWTMVVQASATGDTTIWGFLNSLFQYNLSQSIVSEISMVWAQAGAVLASLIAFGQVILMYYPAIFHDVWLWVWWLIFLPIDISFILCIIFIIRGVHTS